VAGLHRLSREVPAGAEGGRLDPVLARGRAKGAAGVLRHIDEDPAAARPLAGAEAAGVAVADQPGERLGTDGGPHGDELGVHRVVVEPPDAVLERQVRVGRMGGQHVVEQAGRGVEPVLSHQVEQRVQVGGQGHEARHVGGDEGPK